MLLPLGLFQIVIVPQTKVDWKETSSPTSLSPNVPGPKEEMNVEIKDISSI
jgi:hypothetical protein